MSKKQDTSIDPNSNVRTFMKDSKLNQRLNREEELQKKDGIKSDDFDKQNHHLIGENTFGERYDRSSKNLENDSDSDESIEIIRTMPSTQQNLTNNYDYRESRGIDQNTVRPLSTIQPQHKSNMYAQNVERNSDSIARTHTLHNHNTCAEDTQRIPLKKIDCNREPQYLPPHSQGHIPLWTQINFHRNVQIPPLDGGEVKAYKLTLLSQSEFTITAASHQHQMTEPNLNGLRAEIKKITRIHGMGKKAVFEKNVSNEDGGGRWRIPLSAYQPFYSFLCFRPRSIVYGIPTRQLEALSLSQTAKEKSPITTLDELSEYSIPQGLVRALAPYQRDGVGFVLQKEGRALIADEMGLGKTVQGIASMASFENEWPLLVFCPSTARYHWEVEILHWLGIDGIASTTSSCNDTKSTNGEAKKPDVNTVIVNGKKFTFPADDSVNCNHICGEEKERHPAPSSKDHHHNSKRLRTSCSRLKQDDMTNFKEKTKMKLIKSSEINVLSSGKDKIISKNTRVVICSFGLATSLAQCGKIKPGMFRCIIVDESHMLKNKSSQRTKSIIPLLTAASRVILLSGTPAFAKPLELYPQLSVLRDKSGLWDDEDEFISTYGNKDKADPTVNRLAELHTLLTSTVMIRRLKVDTLSSLPNKIREKANITIKNDTIMREIKECMRRLREGKGVLAKLSQSGPTKIIPIEERKTNTEHHKNHTERLRSLCSGKETVESRGSTLSHLFSLTGAAKIPIIVAMLKKWLDDPTKGKLCIFAHHISFLDAIVKKGELSNVNGSRTKFIRIDGSTLPQKRQKEIVRFQTDPTTRIAVLGITAAGIAVTLTAASTIWFAEMFWTPAIMIQAEDRCHRIGQQAPVYCLYIIAMGTLDELLWKLIEKKFTEIGEFVEGQENLKIVVHRTYDDNEMKSIFYERENEVKNVKISDIESRAGEKEREDELTTMENLTESKKCMEYLADTQIIQNDINNLAMEEEKSLMKLQDDDIEDIDDCESRIKSVLPLSQGVTKCAEHVVVCLSDDEDEVDEDKNTIVNRPTQFVDMNKKQLNGEILPSLSTLNIQMPDLRLYRMYFQGPSYKITMFFFEGRIIIANKEGQENTKPSFGDILVQVNDVQIVYSTTLNDVMQMLRRAMMTPPVQLIFGEDNSFRTFLRQHIDKSRSLKVKGKVKQNKTQTAAKVIEILDD